MAKFLIDECLSPDLAEAARQRGFPESSHVVWMGKAGWKDWELKTFIPDGDWTFVARNSVDFRGLAEDPGTKGQYADVALHAGLICINGPATMLAEAQLEMFEALLLEATAHPSVGEDQTAKPDDSARIDGERLERPHERLSAKGAPRTMDVR